MTVLNALSSVPAAVDEEEVADPRSRIRAVAKECLELAGGNWQKAAQRMHTVIMQDRELFDELMMSMFDQAIWHQIRLATHSERKNFHVLANADNADGLSHVATHVGKTLFDHPLSGGVKLGNADAAKLSDESAMHAAMAAGNAKKAKFFSAVMRKLPEGKIVREALTLVQLQQIAKRFL